MSATPWRKVWIGWRIWPANWECLRVPLFMFHEGFDSHARKAFEEIARLSGGACCRFDAGSASQLRELLKAVAVFAAGGLAALQDFSKRSGQQVKLLERQLR